MSTRYGFAGAGNKSTTRPSLSPPAGVQRRMERNRQKLVGWDKGSLTEQQTKGTRTTTIQIRGIHKTKQTAESRSHGPPLHAPETRVSSRRPVPPTGTQHDGTWYGIPSSVWPGWVSPPSSAPSWILLKITLSWPNPGHYPPLIPCHLHHAQIPHCPVDHHHCLQISFPESMDHHSKVSVEFI